MLSFSTGACLIGKQESGSLDAKSSAILAGLVLMCSISLCKLCQLTSCHLYACVHYITDMMSINMEGEAMKT
jgi:hypothetical protein